VVQGLPAAVRLARLGAGGVESGQGIGDEVRPDVGHAPEQDEAELPPRQASHAPERCHDVPAPVGTRSADGVPGEAAPTSAR
jgi:hypothetical protein